ncbi:MarR family transcriptional regulator [Actinoplanes regularis]|uniref:MarR family transcriptional regulator n=1 Tax=Actinoplanes regularis TaxID=52697 RepID=UPI0024A25F54|nr:helix-turn-helix domain-containing protein [Actinoplanes regularis]GLW27569.1 hypothetical protein Areg01_05100 [Actinoplanes regularis]
MAMLHRYRILDAILALREFTVSDLVRYSGVKDNTVRTVLNREARLVERVGVRADGRRGGQQIQYRLRPDAENELIGILRSLDGFGANLPPRAENQEDDPVMLSLIAAENVLLRQLPQAPPGDREELVHLAAADYQTVQMLVADDGGEAATHRKVVELLLRLAEIEQEALRLTAPAPTAEQRDPSSLWAPLSQDGDKKIEAIGRDLYALLQSLPVLADRRLLPDLIRRISNSRFGQAILSAR